MLSEFAGPFLSFFEDRQPIVGIAHNRLLNFFAVVALRLTKIRRLQTRERNAQFHRTPTRNSQHRREQSRFARI